VTRGEKICLIGRNGQGKTTLVKALLAHAPKMDHMPGENPSDDIDGGKVKWGHEAQIGYFAQDHTSTIEKGTTAADWLHQFDPKATKEDIRGVLGQMLFSGEEGMKPTEALSGGEAARLLFCRLMMQKPNFLMNQALQKYEGTVLLVTHDQELIDEVATRIWNFEDHKIQDFKGPYAEFLQTREAVSR
jgi:ATPase subunit of ABC transporter with duplicated ATPase domains